MLKRLDLRGMGTNVAAALPRPGLTPDGPLEAVREILAAVRTGGDQAVRDLTRRFDRVEVDALAVEGSEIASAVESLDPDLRLALEVAADSIRAYQTTQVRAETTHVRNGVVVRDLRLPMARAGVYVPGGRALYPSTVLMSAIPAQVAGVGEVALCVPPGPDGRVPAVTLAAAGIAGVGEVYRVGGAQAVAAMAYGTESIRAVDVIVGPGNVYVALAKREVASEGLVSVPAGFAGPSEVVVVADSTTPATFAALDVMVQAEHGPDGLAWLVTWSEEAADAICAEVERLVAISPRREEIGATLASGGFAALVDDADAAMAVANAVAPEHLQLMCAGAEDLVALVRNAGAVFTGPWAPASVGDYLAGPSHVLPTFGSARYASGLQVGDFCKDVHVVSLDAEALAGVAPHVAAIARAEGLFTHAESVLARTQPGSNPG